MNTINLCGTIGEDVTSLQVKAALEGMDQSKPLCVCIDSEGGEVFDGLSLYEAFAAYPGPKKAIIKPAAFSIASYIAMAFEEIEIVRNGYFMIHNPLISAEGDAATLSARMQLLIKLEQSMVDAYCSRTGQSPEVIRGMMQQDTFFNADEAVQMGFASRVIDTRAPSLMTSPMAIACKLKMPPQVFAALGAVLGGDKREPTKENPLMSTAQPVAATLQEIRAALPKAKADFILTCLEKSMPLAQVQALALDGAMTENDQLQTECAALRAENAQLKAQLATAAATPPAAPPAAPPTLNPDQETMCATPAAVTAKTGLKPVAQSGIGSHGLSAKAQWDAAVKAELGNHGNNKIKAVQAVAKAYPGLRERMVQEANAVA